MRYFYEIKDRYINCKFWHGSKTHAVLNAIFRPAHANRNLHSEF